MSTYNKLNIKGKNILFIGQVFYDYHTKILNEMITQGANVTFIKNHFHGDGDIPSFDIVGQLRKLVIPLNKKVYAKKIIDSIKGKNFDYLFCIGGFSITPYLVSQICEHNPQIIKIIYFWDSFKTWNYSKLLNLFDSVYSFDPRDSEKFEKINYLPLFYTKEYQADINVVKDLDILYIGSISYLAENRLEILQKVEMYANKNNLKIFIWLYNADGARSTLGKMQSLIKKFTSEKYKQYINLVSSGELPFLTQKTLSRDEIIQLMKRAKCVVDIPIPNQFGLTIRTIETLALNNKLLTTNIQIAAEPFYNKKCIQIIDEHNLNFDLEFIKDEEKCIINIEQLELKNWILTMFK